MITLAEIYVARGDIEKIYRASLGVTLWRAVRKESSGDGSNPLEPDFEERTLPNGMARLPDVATYLDPKGLLWVKAEESRGTSLSDSAGLFGHGKWEYVVIPAGTIIPDELIITRDHYIAQKNRWHYSISPNYDMPVATFRRALDVFACNAGIQLKGRLHA